MKLIEIGYGNSLNAEEVLAVMEPNSAPMKRKIKVAREDDKFIDATEGRKTLSIIITKKGNVVASAFGTKVIKKRLSMENE
ncbi:MAG: DUF370 domain-containing protein [uncultured Clostridium sp.]